MQTASRVPAIVEAGTSLNFSVSAGSYSASDWTGTIYFVGPNVYSFPVPILSGSADVSISGGKTAEISPGSYKVSIRVINGDEAHSIFSGEIRFRPNIAAAGPGSDLRTENERAYQAICDVLARRSTQDQDRYRINNRELWRTSISDLLALKAHYAQLVQSEKLKANGGNVWGRKVRERFL